MALVTEVSEDEWVFDQVWFRNGEYWEPGAGVRGLSSEEVSNICDNHVVPALREAWRNRSLLVEMLVRKGVVGMQWLEESR